MSVFRGATRIVRRFSRALAWVTDYPPQGSVVPIVVTL